MLGHFRLLPPSWTMWHTQPRSHAGIDPMPDKMNLDLIVNFKSTRLLPCLKLVVRQKNTTIPVVKQQNTSNTLFNSWLLLVVVIWSLSIYRDKPNLGVQSSLGYLLNLKFLCTAVLQPNVGSLSKHDVNGSENVIWKYNFAFLQSFFNYSKSLCLINVF